VIWGLVALVLLLAFVDELAAYVERRRR